MIENSKLKKCGVVRAMSAKEIGDSFFGIGFEKLDRNVFDPEKAYDKLAQIGVKLVRLQSGWARTEKEKGVYDFAWLDGIVDNLIARGMKPWICLCYGNALYTPAAEKVFGAVGCPPIATPEERAAWAKYVTALTKHFRSRVSMYEVWNEPDGGWCWKHGASGAEYGEFVIATAAAVRAGDPEAKVLGGSMCGSNWDWLDKVFSTGAGKVMDFFVYHGYSANELRQPERIREIRAILHCHGLDSLPLIQGETGSPSRDDGFGALRRGAWTQLRQAKVLLRLMFQHIALGVKFTSYFTTVDMIEALNGTVGDKASYLDYGYFGVLAADFDENGFSTGEYTPKMSYRALQVISAVFRDLPEVDGSLPVFETYPHESPRTFRQSEPFGKQSWVGFRRANGSAALVYWHPSDPLVMDVDSTMSLKTLLDCSKVRLIDLMDGTVYELDPGLFSKTEEMAAGRDLYVPVEGNTRLTWLCELPLRDYPLALVFGDFF